MKRHVVRMLANGLCCSAVSAMAWTLDFEREEPRGVLPASCKVCPEAAASGKQGLLMTGKGPFFAAYKVPVEPGKRHWVKMKVKVLEWGPYKYRNFTFILEPSNYVHPGWCDDEYFEGLSRPGGWQEIRYISRTMPKDSKEATLKLHFDYAATGVVWVDDIEVTPIDLPGDLYELAVASPKVVGDEPWGLKLKDPGLLLLEPGAYVEARLIAKGTENRRIQQARLTAEKPEAVWPTEGLNDGIYIMRHALYDKDNKKVSERVDLHLVKKALLECRPIPHAALLTEQELPLQVEIRPEASGKAGVKLVGKDGRIAALNEAWVFPEETRRINLGGKLAPGQYDLVALLNGKEQSRQVINILSKEEAKTKTRLGSDGFLYRNGRRHFPLVVYAHTFNHVNGEEGERGERDWTHTERILNDLQGSPFGLLDYGTPIGGVKGTLELLDACAKRNIPVILSFKDVYENHPLGFFALRQKEFGNKKSIEVVEEVLRAVKERPEVLAYYTNDELNTDFMKQMVAVRELCHRVDPGRPVLHAHMRNDYHVTLAQSYDVWGTEQYPWPQPNNVTRIADWSRTSIAQIPDTAPYWGVLWIYHEARDNRLAQRALAYSTIANGAKGLLFYSWFEIWHYGAKQNPEETWKVFLDFGKELERDLPIFLLDDADDKACSETPHLSCRTFAGPEGRYLLVVNTDSKASRAELTIPNATSAKALYDAKRKYPVTKDQLVVEMSPYEALILKVK